MPLVSSQFTPKWIVRNRHIQTAYPTLFRSIPEVNYERERIETSDGDFLDLDWLKVGNAKLAILSHGLEGSSQAIYVRGMAKLLVDKGWDVLAWNYRGCSGEPNKKLYWYHSGKSEDLREVINEVASRQEYDAIALLGFSVGGNITLKYLGESPQEVPKVVIGAVTFSVPVDLAGCADQFKKLVNVIHMKRFLRTLRAKVREKKSMFPTKLDDSSLMAIKNFHDFDEEYTAPLNGFSSAADYWSKSSSLQFLSSIKVPTLLLSSMDDTFLSDSCYPHSIAQESDSLYFQQTKYGGHIGFLDSCSDKVYFSERRAIEFLEEKCNG